MGLRGGKGWGREGWGPRRVGAVKGGGPNRAFFSLSRHNFLSFFSLCGSFRGIVSCLKRRGPEMCTSEVLWLSCEAPRRPTRSRASAQPIQSNQIGFVRVSCGLHILNVFTFSLGPQNCTALRRPSATATPHSDVVFPIIFSSKRSRCEQHARDFELGHGRISNSNRERLMKFAAVGPTPSPPHHTTDQQPPPPDPPTTPTAPPQHLHNEQPTTPPKKNWPHAVWPNQVWPNAATADESPFHTTASGFTNLATLVSSSNGICCDSSLVPDLGLALMDINMRMSSELFSDDSFNLGNAIWPAHECEEFHLVTQPTLSCFQCWMLSGEQSARGSPCSPPSAMTYSGQSYLGPGLLRPGLLLLIFFCLLFLHSLLFSSCFFFFLFFFDFFSFCFCPHPPEHLNT